MFEWLFKKNKTHQEMKLLVKTIKELDEKKIECEILYKSLMIAGLDVYKYTGNIKDMSPETYIDKAKINLGIYKWNP